MRLGHQPGLICDDWFEKECRLVNIIDALVLAHDFIIVVNLIISKGEKLVDWGYMDAQAFNDCGKSACHYEMQFKLINTDELGGGA